MGLSLCYIVDTRIQLSLVDLDRQILQQRFLPVEDSVGLDTVENPSHEVLTQGDESCLCSALYGKRWSRAPNLGIGFYGLLSITDTVRSLSSIPGEWFHLFINRALTDRTTFETFSAMY